jgi:hypothetical protein
VSLPAQARVRAVPNFIASLDAARDFMVAQDSGSAPLRFGKLQAALVKGRALLEFAPGSGRPVRFLESQTDWGRYQASQARQLASALGLPELRELVLLRHVLLYAHSAQEVVLLALRHERQLGYALPPLQNSVTPRDRSTPSRG